ncbi:MAG: helix-turn-helix domain-containing protein [Anaerolineae bacterium]|nr:helix-turn-helix domain-containing protein [Anaerolineae bacterium]MCA9890061.1 helix-turn-helix domain-containing protein [Anaerolineae bacterium]MCA9892041.1 helix-turn-helix domain-containing protein [Anaerolineae bacterium]
MKRSHLRNINTTDDADSWKHFNDADHDLFHRYDPDKLIDQLEQAVEETKRQVQIRSIYGKVLAILDDREREVLIRYYLKEHSATYIAQEMNYCRKTIYNIINRARDKVCRLHREVVGALRD